MLAKVRRLSWAERRLLLEAFLWLGAARFCLLIIPFRRIAPLLGAHMAQTGDDVSLETARLAQRVGWAVSAAARRTPWESACLAQAIGAKAMLRRRQIDSTLYLGVARDEKQALTAHAWLRCGSAIVTGGDHSSYTVISSFAEQPAAVAGAAQEKT
ncbi:MAG TPA: lasso peptide biosynthesis B2 protein [Candidatus Binatia bacterium]|nr:lasso peptide biosynthesis B2 protein [Candidatus Binatia bacterium]